MAIKIHLDDILKERNMTSKELCKKVHITEANLSILSEINPEYSLDGLMLKLQYFGHLMG